MRLRQIHLERSSGLRGPILLQGLSPTFNVILGSNGSGKSSLCRAMSASLWNTNDFRGAVRAAWSSEQGDFSSTRESGAPPRWSTPSGEAPVALPEARFRGCFTLSVDDFLKDSGTDAQIQFEIRKELAAGYDLSLVTKEFKVTGPVRGKADELSKATGEARRIRSEHRELSREEQDLEERSQELQEATRARSEVPLFAAALELAKAREELQRCSESLEAFPAEMERLSGNEGEQLAEKRKDLLACEQNLESARRDASEAEQALARVDLPKAVAVEELQELSTRESALRATETELAGIQQREAQIAAEIESLRRELRLNGAADNRSVVDGELWSQLEAVLRDLEGSETACGQLEAELESLTLPKDTASEGLATERAIAILSDWLQATGADLATVRYQSIAAALLGLVLIVAGVADFGSALVLLLCGAASVALGVWLHLGQRTNERATHQQDFARLGLKGPSEWTGEGVTERVGGLISDLERQRQGGLVQERSRLLQSRLNHAKEDRGQLLDRLETLCERCAVPADTARLGILEIARALRERTEAERRLATTQAEKAELRSKAAQTLGAANEILGRYGVDLAKDADQLRARQRGLELRETQRQSSSSQLQKANANQDLFKGQLAERRESLRAFVAKLGFDPATSEDSIEAELARRLASFEEWKGWLDRQRDAERQLARLEAELDARPELTDLGVIAAQQAIERNAAQADRCVELIQEIESVRAQVNKARSGHELEDALAAEESAREALFDLREQHFELAAAEFLLESVARDHQSLAQPDILRRAGVLFGDFTHQRYQLKVAPYDAQGVQAFEIREAEGARKALDELSSGTLSQLCLALRLAVAQSIEGDEVLPLWLDEALTNSDPARFEEVVRSLVGLAERGRQIFFLTSDPADAARLEAVLSQLGQEPPRRFNLDELSGRERRATQVEIEALPEIPAPKSDEAPAAYAQRIGVPRIDPLGSVDELHPYYLCRDDLEALHQVLRKRVETVGALRNLLRTHPKTWMGERRERFEALRTVAATWLTNHAIGRSRSLSPEILREGPAGTTKFIDELVDINGEFEGNAAQLIAALETKGKLRDPRLKGFKSAKLAELREDLEEGGYLSAAEPLTDVELNDRCLQSAEGWLEREILRHEDVVQLANALGQWIAA